MRPLPLPSRCSTVAPPSALQAAALECGEQGGNLVYCAPTSGTLHTCLLATQLPALLPLELHTCLPRACPENQWKL